MIRHLAGAPAGVALADPHQYSNCRERVYREEHPELCPIERAESPTAVPSRGHGGGGGSGGGMQGYQLRSANSSSVAHSICGRSVAHSICGRSLRLLDR